MVTIAIKPWPKHNPKGPQTFHKKTELKVKKEEANTDFVQLSGIMDHLDDSMMNDCPNTHLDSKMEDTEK